MGLNGAAHASYIYDSNSNRTSQTSSGVTKNGTYDGQDRLLTYGTKSFAYNLNGEMTSFTDSASHLTTSYGWDSRGELKTVTLPTKKSVTYLRDVAGNPSVRSSGGVITVWNVFNHRNQLIATLDPALSAAVSKRFVYGTNPSVPDYMFVPSTGHTFKFVTDHLGSPVEIIDVNTGAVAEEIHYDDFGNVTSDSNPGFQPFGFAGGLYDQDTKLTHFGRREYDASIGRWLSKDPILFGGGGTNLYGYVLADPINYIDPSGLSRNGGFGKCVAGAGMTAFGIVSFPNPYALIPIAVGLGMVNSGINDINQAGACGDPPPPPGNPPGSPPGGGGGEPGGSCKAQ